MAVFMRLAAAGGGNNLLSFTQSLGKNWLGTPIVTCESLPGISSANTVSQPCFYYGDPSQSLAVGERRGITTAVSKDVGFVSDLIYVRSTQRLGTKELNLGSNSTYGSMVTLTTAAS